MNTLCMAHGSVLTCKKKRLCYVPLKLKYVIKYVIALITLKRLPKNTQVQSLNVAIVCRFEAGVNSWAEWELNLARTLNIVLGCQKIAALMSSKLWNYELMLYTAQGIRFHLRFTRISLYRSEFHRQIWWFVFASYWFEQIKVNLLFRDIQLKMHFQQIAYRIFM